MRKITLLIISIISLGISAQNPEDFTINSLKHKFNLSEFDIPTEIIEFNKDTILVVGYFADLLNPESRNEQKKNVVYKTTDGGKNWRIIKFNGDAWIYDAYYKKDGKVWMGGSDSYIHYSNDFGDNWHRKIKPFLPVNRVLSIFMVDSIFGIAGGLSNGLATTTDNWSSSRQIQTPLDQKRFLILEQSSRDRIDKIAIIDSLVIINQNDYIFYSKINKVEWRKFSLPVSSFNINEKEKEIDLVSLNGKHFVIGSDLKLKKTYQEDYILYYATHRFNNF